MQFTVRPYLVVTIFGILMPGSVFAQPRPASPPVPDKYQAEIRYRIIVPRDEHVARYDALISHLASLGIEFNKESKNRPKTDREDLSKDRLHGLIPGKNILKILNNLDVAGLLLIPQNWKLPADPNKTVRIQLEIVPNYGNRQRVLSRQVAALLGQFEFNEAIAYDHRGYVGQPYTRLVGDIPMKHLRILLKDLRHQPSGWLKHTIDAKQLPKPIVHQSPIRFVEVLADPNAITFPAPPPDRGDAVYEKITPPLWNIVNDPIQLPSVAIQVILRSGSTGAKWHEALLTAAPDFFIEGRLGSYVTGHVPPRQIKKLAKLDQVSVIRLQRKPHASVAPNIVTKNQLDAIRKRTGLAKLHQQEHLGQGIKIAILDRDFRGYQSMINAKLLPAKTRLVDITTMRDANLPLPTTGSEKEIGHGTQCAMAVALAAPSAEIVLIRLDVAAPFQIQQITHMVQGRFDLPYVQKRLSELRMRRAELRFQFSRLKKEGAEILSDFKDEMENETNFGFLGPVRGWIFSKRLWHYHRLVYHEKEVAEFDAKQKRFDTLFRTILSLQGIDMVVSPFLWNDGFPLGGESAISRWFADDPKKKPLWIQSAGHTRGQCWHGHFHDADGNAVMEFVDDQSKIKPQHWTAEVNFLQWQPFQGKPQDELPATATIRASIQWKEVHDPDYYGGKDDFYRIPLMRFRLVLLRQRDPSGKTIRADSFEVVTVSSGWAQRLLDRPNFAIYEQSFEIPLKKAGRYAIRVERQLDEFWIFGPDKSGKLALHSIGGFIPESDAPLGVPVLPALKRHWELKPRLFIDVTDDVFRKQGRPVFADYFTNYGTIGVPATGRTIISVGAASLNDRPQLYSGIGPPANISLFPAPTTWMYDAIAVGPAGTGGAFGSSLSTSFTAGMAASLLSSGMTVDELQTLLDRQRSTIFEVPNREKK